MTPDLTLNLNNNGIFMIMGSVSFFVNLGILWFLITLFTHQTNSGQSLKIALGVIFGVGLANVILSLLFYSLFMPSNYYFALFFHFLRLGLLIAAFYFILDKLCEAGSKANIKICGGFFAIYLIIDLVSSWLH